MKKPLAILAAIVLFTYPSLTAAMDRGNQWSHTMQMQAFYRVMT